MAGYNLKNLYEFGGSGKAKKGTKRDKLVREKGGKVIYKVWDNPIVVLNTKKNILSVSDAGWQTKLTKDRLNKILVRNSITQKNYEWYLRTEKGDLHKFKGHARFKVRWSDIF